MKAISMIELNSIARGVLVTDYVGKTSEVNILRSHSVCPGKFIVMFSGSVGSVEASLKVAEKMGESNVVNSILLPNIDERVIEAINGTAVNTYKDAIGVVEYFSIASSIEGADIAVKSADICLVTVRMGFAIGGKSYITFTGKVSAVEEAVKAATYKAAKDGMLVDSVIVPSPIEELYTTIL